MKSVIADTWFFLCHSRKEFLRKKIEKMKIPPCEFRIELLK